MIRVTCPGCGSTLSAKPTLAGQSRKCPKCGTPVQIPTAAERPGVSADQTLDAAESTTGQPIAGAIEEHLTKVQRPERLARLNRYLICDRTKVFATWADNGEGWMLKTNAGLVKATRNPDLLPPQGTFTLVELIMSEGDDGLRLTGIACYKLADRWAMVALEQDDDQILSKIQGPGSLNREQKAAVYQQIKAQLMPEVWQHAGDVREYLSNMDYTGSGTA